MRCLFMTGCIVKSTRLKVAWVSLSLPACGLHLSGEQLHLAAKECIQAPLLQAALILARGMRI